MSTDERSKVSAREINETIRYTCWAVFARTGITPPVDAAGELEAVVAKLAKDDVIVRGFYDVSAMRADAQAR